MAVTRDSSSTVSRGSRLHSPLLFATLILALGAAYAAVDEDRFTAIASEAQVMGRQGKEVLPKTAVSEGHQPKVRHSNMETLQQHEVQGSMSLLQAMQKQVDSAKRLATLGRSNKRRRLFRELQFWIKEAEQAIGASAIDADLPKSAPETMRALSRALSRAIELHNKCEDTVRRLHSSVVVNENKVIALQKENKFLRRLAARTMPKGLHCLALQLTVQYYQQFKEASQIADETKLYHGGLLHYAVYTENVLAATAIVNSTLYFAKEPHRHVFHVLTSGLNYAAMRMWFGIYPPHKSVVEVKNLDSWNDSGVSWALHEGDMKYLKPVTSRAHLEQDDNLEMRKRIGLYMHLPRVFPKLDKLLVLDDDIVVRKDLTHLWEVDLDNKVIGSVRSSSTREAANDWSCINIVDLGSWRRQKLTEIYEQLILTPEEDAWDGIGSLHDNNTHMLHSSAFYVLELDDTPSELDNDTQNAAAIHYGGYVKPWLGMGMSWHRSLWTRFVDYENPLLQACNINK